MDEAISTVVAVTNCSPERAAQYVTLTDGNAEQAITLYFENDGADLSGSLPSNPHTSQPTSQPTNRGSSEHPIDLDQEHPSDDDIPEFTGSRRAAPGQSSVDDDEAMARRLQEEMYGGDGQEGDVVRAPIARQTETLLGPGADMGPMPSMDDAIQQRMFDIQRRRGQGFRPGIFNQQATSAIWNGEENENNREVLAQSTGGASETSAKSNTLARLFQPPWDLMYNGPWEKARDDGKEEQKWLLVNIQDGSVFQCQILNRDLWKNASVVDTVKEHFIFLQYSKEDIRAKEYLQYYFQDWQTSDAYPHVAILDPRTGERLKLWSRDVPAPAEFLMQLHDFLDRYSLNNEVRNPVAKRKSEVAAKKSVDQMSEEEMMEMALQQSLASQNNELKVPAVEDPDELTRSIGDLRRPGDAMSIYENGEEAETTPFSLIASDRPYVEPVASAPKITRIQLKHPGGREIRKFALSDPVRRIYEILKAEPLPGKEGAEFELVSMGKNLMESIDNTIDQAGLKNSVVMIEFVE